MGDGMEKRVSLFPLGARVSLCVCVSVIFCSMFFLQLAVLFPRSGIVYCVAMMIRMTLNLVSDDGCIEGYVSDIYLAGAKNSAVAGYDDN